MECPAKLATIMNANVFLNRIRTEKMSKVMWSNIFTDFDLISIKQPVHNKTIQPLVPVAWKKEFAIYSFFFPFPQPRLKGDFTFSPFSLGKTLSQYHFL